MSTTRPSSLSERLRPGRDPNGVGWVGLRTRADWARALSIAGLAFDAGAKALQLAPVPAPELAGRWWPDAPVLGRDGTAYRADAAGHRVLVKRRCDVDWQPLRGIGGLGAATGRLNRPRGLTLDASGRLLVADSGNRRVQVILPHEGRAAEVLAVLDSGLREPVHAVTDACGEIFVADRGTGRVHVFSARFAPRRVLMLRSLDPFSETPWTEPPAARPLAIAITAAGTLAVFDPQRAWLWQMTPQGQALPALPWPDAGRAPPGWADLPLRCSARGEAVLGPLDSGAYNFGWHELLVDAQLPAGTSVQLQSFAHNDAAAAPAPWAPRRPAAIVEACGGARLVLPDVDAWQRWRAGSLARAQPRLHHFDGDGPTAGDRLRLPAAAARALRVGDRVSLQADAGGEVVATIAAIDAGMPRIAAIGGSAAFAAPAALRLLQRDGEALPYGALDLDFLLAARPLPIPAWRDGRLAPLPLPHALCAFLRPGDVVELADAHGAAAQFEFVEPADQDVAVRLDAAVPGDFSHAWLSLVAGRNRLIVADELPTSGACPVGTDAIVAADVHSDTARVLFAEAGDGFGTLWLAPGSLAGPVDTGSWRSVTFAEPVATDRGRYLWLRLVLTGAPLGSSDEPTAPPLAGATPRILGVRATGPRPSLLAWLPVVFSRRDPMAEPPGANFLERFLTLFEGRFNDIERAYESIGRLLNPRAADAQWLDFVASWIDLAFDPSWPIERRRQLVIAGAGLQAGSGTAASLVRYLEIYTGAPVGLVEGFKRRPPLPIQLGA
ncbi:MAG TPA: phage tail protein, partial [Burkholderiaceae bacterium]|nr:phage tail protein [Burkholderiaceae bacterium]